MAAILDQTSPVTRSSPPPQTSGTLASSATAPRTEVDVPGAVSLGDNDSHTLKQDDSNVVSGRLTIVRVKRKRSDAPTDSLWLEVGGGGAFKRMHFGGLNLDDGEEEFAAAAAPPQRSLFRLLDTFPEGSDASSAASSAALLAAVAARRKRKTLRVGGREERQERERAALREQELASARGARYQQVRKSRQVGPATSAVDAATSELLLYDVVRMEDDADVAARTRREQAKKEAAAREGQLLCNFLPLLREVLPEAGRAGDAGGTGVEHSGDEYVFDVYCAEEDGTQEDQPFFDSCPVVQILEDEEYDYREGRASDADSEDSNDENNEGNDYPDEEDEEDEEGTFRKRESRGMWDLGSDDEIDPYGDNNVGAYDTVAYDEEQEEIVRQRRNGDS